MLRFLTAGSVDDGKSTLIGRLLYDTKAILADQLAAVSRTSRQARPRTLDLSLLTDGLNAEREQGITIDVAYRYFATGAAQVHHRRRAGARAVHAQHGHRRRRPRSSRSCWSTRATACVTQTRRHATLAHLLGIPHLVVAVNKMDLVDYREEDYARIVADFRAFAQRTRHRRRGGALRADVRAGRRHGRRARRSPAVVRRPDAAADPRDGGRRHPRDSLVVPVSRAVRRPSRRPRRSRLSWPRRGRRHRHRRGGDGAAFRPDVDRARAARLRPHARPGATARRGHHHARRRARRVARRRPRRDGGGARAACAR